MRRMWYTAVGRKSRAKIERRFGKRAAALVAWSDSRVQVENPSSSHFMELLFLTQLKGCLLLNTWIFSILSVWGFCLHAGKIIPLSHISKSLGEYWNHLATQVIFSTEKWCLSGLQQYVSNQICRKTARNPKAPNPHLYFYPVSLKWGWGRNF